MKKIKYILIFFVLMNSITLYTQSTLVPQSYKTNSTGAVYNENNKNFYRSMQTEPGKTSGKYVIGPEIPVNGATGFYDYQSNGECRRQINRYSENILMSVFFSAVDSSDIASSRRTVYCGSTDDGSNWKFISQIPPDTRSGFPALTTTENGSAVIFNNNGNNTALAKELTPLSGLFNYYTSPILILQSLCSRFSNSKILVSGLIMSDSVTALVFDPNINTFSNINKLFAATNLRVTHSTGPDGKALMLFLSSNDNGKIYISFTENYGITWSAPSLIIEAGMINEEFAVPFLGIDAIYDNSGNYYIAFNTTDTLGRFSSAKLWVSKNGESPVIVAQNSGPNGVPNAVTVLHADAGFCTIDHPSLSVSADGNWIFCAFSVQFQNDTLNGFNKCHIYYTGSAAGILNFFTPVQVTNSGPDSYDERYASLNPVSPDLGGNSGITLYLSYQKDTQPGSCAFNDAAPLSRSNQIFRKIYTSNIPIGITNTGSEIPKIYELYQNYPNPFNPATKIRFSVPVSSNITLEIFDSAGRLVKTLVRNRTVTAGLNEVNFSAGNLPSGVYFYKLSAGYHSITRKMVLIK